MKGMLDDDMAASMGAELSLTGEQLRSCKVICDATRFQQTLEPLGCQVQHVHGWCRPRRRSG